MIHLKPDEEEKKDEEMKEDEEDDEDFVEMGDYVQELGQLGRTRGASTEEELHAKKMLELLLEKTWNKAEEDEDDKEAKVFFFFRKVFDKLPEREEHVKSMVEINKDFCGMMFEGDTKGKKEIEELKEVLNEPHGNVKGSFNSIGESQMKDMYDHLKGIPKIKKIFDAIEKAVPEE